MARVSNYTKPPDDDIEDICNEFGITAGFVDFVWAILQGDGDNITPLVAATRRAVPIPLRGFLPRTKRECALACMIALRGIVEEEDDDD